MILVIDNYDSFTYNLVDMLAQEVDVVVSYPEDLSLKEIDDDTIEGVIISPGPGHPLDNGSLLNIIERYKAKPILGVCLGSQALTCYYGGDVIQSEHVKHGKVDRMRIVEKTKLYKNITEYSEIMRYHSLVSDLSTFPKTLKITAKTKDCIQSFEHMELPHYGIQFHPESFATEKGQQIIRNFISITKEVHQDGTHD